MSSVSGSPNNFIYTSDHGKDSFTETNAKKVTPPSRPSSKQKSEGLSRINGANAGTNPEQYPIQTSVHIGDDAERQKACCDLESAVASLQRFMATVDRPTLGASGILGTVKAGMTGFETVSGATASLDDTREVLSYADIPLPSIRIAKVIVDFLLNALTARSLRNRRDEVDHLEQAIITVMLRDHQDAMLLTVPKNARDVLFAAANLIIGKRLVFGHPAAAAIQFGSAVCSVAASLSDTQRATTQQIRAQKVKDYLSNHPLDREAINPDAAKWLDAQSKSNKISLNLFAVLRQNPDLLNQLYKAGLTEKELHDLVEHAHYGFFKWVRNRLFFRKNAVSGSAVMRQEGRKGLIRHAVNEPDKRTSEALDIANEKAGLFLLPADPDLPADHSIISTAREEVVISSQPEESMPLISIAQTGGKTKKTKAEVKAGKLVEKTEEALFGANLRQILRSSVFGKTHTRSGQSYREAFIENYRELLPEGKQDLKSLFHFDASWFNNFKFWQVNNKNYGGLVSKQDRQKIRLTLATLFAEGVSLTDLEDVRPLLLTGIEVYSSPTSNKIAGKGAEFASRLLGAQDRFLEKTARSHSYAQADAYQAMSTLTGSTLGLVMGAVPLQIYGLLTGPYLVYSAIRLQYIAGSVGLASKANAAMKSQIMRFIDLRAEKTAADQAENDRRRGRSAANRVGSLPRNDLHTSILANLAQQRNTGGMEHMLQLQSLPDLPPGESMTSLDEYMQTHNKSARRRVSTALKFGGKGRTSGARVQSEPDLVFVESSAYLDNRSVSNKPDQASGPQSGLSSYVAGDIDISRNPYRIVVDTSDALAAWGKSLATPAPGTILDVLFRLPLSEPQWLVAAKMPENQRINWLFSNIFGDDLRLRFASEQLIEEDKARALSALSEGRYSTAENRLKPADVPLDRHLGRFGYEGIVNYGSRGIDSLIYSVIQSLRNASYVEDSSMTKQFSTVRTKVLEALPGADNMSLIDEGLLKKIFTACLGATGQDEKRTAFTYVTADLSGKMIVKENIGAESIRDGKPPKKNVICGIDQSTNICTAIFGHSAGAAAEFREIWHGTAPKNGGGKGKPKSGESVSERTARIDVPTPYKRVISKLSDISFESIFEKSMEIDESGHREHLNNVDWNNFNSAFSRLSFSVGVPLVRATGDMSHLNPRDVFMPVAETEAQVEAEEFSGTGTKVWAAPEISNWAEKIRDTAQLLGAGGTGRQPVEDALDRHGVRIVSMRAEGQNCALASLLAGTDPAYLRHPEKLSADARRLRTDLVNEVEKRHGKIDKNEMLMADGTILGSLLIELVNKMKNVNLTYGILYPTQESSDMGGGQPWYIAEGRYLEKDVIKRVEGSQAPRNVNVVLFNNGQHYDLIVPIVSSRKEQKDEQEDVEERKE